MFDLKLKNHFYVWLYFSGNLFEYLLSFQLNSVVWYNVLILNQYISNTKIFHYLNILNIFFSSLFTIDFSFFFRKKTSPCSIRKHWITLEILISIEALLYSGPTVPLPDEAEHLFQGDCSLFVLGTPFHRKFYTQESPQVPLARQSSNCLFRCSLLLLLNKITCLHSKTSNTDNNTWPRFFGAFQLENCDKKHFKTRRVIGRLLSLVSGIVANHLMVLYKFFHSSTSFFFRFIV